PEAISTRPRRVLIIKVRSFIFKPRSRLFTAVTLLLVLLGGRVEGASLPRPVLQALNGAGIPSSAAHVVVKELDSPRTALSLNAGQAVNPASVMKLVTTYAALELLGPAFRWKTEVYLDGADLVLRGGGDPKLDYESF